MIRVIHSADWHLGLARHEPRPGARVEDARAVMQRFVEVAVASRCQVAVFAGDTFHTRFPTPRALDVLGEGLAGLASAGITSLVEEGNHDGKDGLGPSAVHTIGFLERLRVPRVHVLLEPGTRQVEVLDGLGLPAVVQVTTLPYPHKRAYDHLYPEMDPDLRPIAVGRDLDEVVRAWGEDLDQALPSLLVGHLTILGAKVGSERTMGLDWDVQIPAGTLAPWGYAALGHVHRQQRVDGPGNAAYAGSPMYVDFGEVGQPKGFLVADVAPGALPAIRAASSSPRPLQTVIVAGPAEEWAIGGVEPGAVVQPVVMGPQPRAEALSDLAAQLRAAGAWHVLASRVETPDQVDRRRAGDGAADLDPTANLARWVGDNVPEAERAAVLKYGETLIQEVF